MFTLVLAACASSFDPSQVNLSGKWDAANAYSGCGIGLDLVDADGVITGTATTVCPSPGPTTSQVTGTRTGATLNLSFDALGSREHRGLIVDRRHFTLEFALPDGPRTVRFASL